ncbi:MAG: lysylphosphatidylglycerol synthase transmembrane domain-containing protein [Chitinophagaceae bacterium]
MKKKILGLLKYLLFLGLGIFLLWLTLRKSNWEEIKHDILTADFIYLIPATLMLLMSHFSRAVRWKILIEPLGYKPSILNTFLAVMVGYWANLAVPRLGEVLKCTILGRYEKVPADKLVGTIVAERAFDVASLVVLMTATIIFQYDLIGQYAGSQFTTLFENKAGKVSYTKIFITIGIIALAILLVIYLLKRLAHLSFIKKTRQFLKGIWQGLTSVRYIKNKGWFFFHTVLIWAMYLFSTYMGFFAMRDMSHYGLSAAFSALSFGSIGMVIPSPGGIGSYQYAVQQVLLLYGISAEKGLSLGMLIWFAQTGILIIFGTLSFILLPIVNRSKKINRSENEKPGLHSQ